MRESYGEGLATRTGPESCAEARKGLGEALTGVYVGRVLSRENIANFGVPTPWVQRKATPVASPWRDAIGPCAVEDLVHAYKAPRAGTGRSRGRPECVGAAVGKPEGVIHR